MAKRNYENKYPSVTQILGVLRKPGLENWFKFNTAKFCNDASNKGKLIGKQIHEAIEMFITTGKAQVKSEYGDEVVTALHSFMEFRKSHNIKMNISEIACTSELHKFNGTIDCLGDDVIIDWKTTHCKEKTTPPIYDEWKYQVAAYVHLYNEVHNAKIDRAIIVGLAKDKVAYSVYTLNSEEINEIFKRVFLPALSILNYQKTDKERTKERKKNGLRNGNVKRETAKDTAASGVA